MELFQDLVVGSVGGLALRGIRRLVFGRPEDRLAAQVSPQSIAENEAESHLTDLLLMCRSYGTTPLTHNCFDFSRAFLQVQALQEVARQQGETIAHLQGIVADQGPAALTWGPASNHQPRSRKRQIPQQDANDETESLAAKR